VLSGAVHRGDCGRGRGRVKIGLAWQPAGHAFVKHHIKEALKTNIALNFLA
jgi:hypothetical protein